MDNDILNLLYLYGYWIIFFGVMLDNVGIPIPGEIFLLTAGALTGNGALGFKMSAVVAVTGAVMGGSFSYYIGRWSGMRLINLYCRYTLCTSDCSKKSESFYTRFGVIAIPMARFIMGVRTLAAPLAGAVGITYIKFLILDTIGASIWAVTFLFIGFIFRNSIMGMMPLFDKAREGFIIGILFVLIAFVSFKFIRRRLIGSPNLLKIIQRLRSFRKSG